MAKVLISCWYLASLRPFISACVRFTADKEALSNLRSSFSSESPLEIDESETDQGDVEDEEQP